MFPFREPLHPDADQSQIRERSDGMEHWPGHERAKTTEKPNDKGKQKERRVEPSFWQWPHLEHGSIGRITLVPKDGRVQWSSVVDTSHGMWILGACRSVLIRVLDTRWLPLDRPTKVFPETRSPQVDTHEHSARQRAENGVRAHPFS